MSKTAIAPKSVTVPAPKTAKEKPAKVEPTLQDMLHVLTVLEKAKDASAEVHGGTGKVILERYLRDLRRKLKPFEVREIKYVAKS